MKKIVRMSFLYLAIGFIVILKNSAVLGSCNHFENSVNCCKNTIGIGLKRESKDFGNDSSVVRNQPAPSTSSVTSQVIGCTLADTYPQSGDAALQERRVSYDSKNQEDRLKLMANQYRPMFAKATAFNQKDTTLKRLQEESFEALDEEGMARQIREQHHHKRFADSLQASLQTPSNLSMTQGYEDDSLSYMLYSKVEQAGS